MNRMKPWKKWALAMALMVSAAVSVYAYASAGNTEGIEVRIAAVKRGNMCSILSSGGIIESGNRKDYFASAPAKIEKIYVRVGDRVDKNQLLIRFEVPDISPQLKQAYIQLDIAKTTLDSLRRQKAGACEKEHVQIPDAGFDMLSIPEDIDDKIKIQEKQVEIAELNIKSLKDKINRSQSEIKSTGAGVVTGINGVEGGPANVGLPVITVEDTENIKAVLNVSQYDALKLKEGQEAVVKVGGEQKEYQGRVDRISPTAKKVMAGTSIETSIPVEVSILNPDSSVKIGFDVDADIMVNSKADVLYIPDEAVITNKAGDNSVYLVKGNKAVLKSIKLGMGSDFYYEVMEGLSEGDMVILNPLSGLKDGSQIRAVN